MTKEFNSQIFGETREATDNELEDIRTILQETPVAVFQELNKILNEKGLCISIDTKPHSVN